jgi:N-acetylglucosaminyldiphosphoundecaprenol N-acetyl-beta-D-mannosaminyltransferase
MTWKILGVRVDFGLKIKDVLFLIEEKFLKDEASHYICTTNAEFIMEAQKSREFVDIINKSDLSVSDGAGVVFASHYLNKVSKMKRTMFFPVKCLFNGLSIGFSSFGNKEIISERITGVELTEKICELSAKKDYSVFFLGGWPKNFLGSPVKTPSFDLAQKACEHVRLMYPKVNIIGASSKFSYKSRDDKPTVKYIKECMSAHGVKTLDFLLVGYGHYKQEAWIVRNMHKIPVRVSIGVGGTFDYLSKLKKRSPKPIENLNLEWFFKLITQPWRVRRILNASLVFPIRVYINSLKH